MRVLIVGAGASIEEAIRADVPEELWPPTTANFAKKMWDSPPGNLFYCYWLADYLGDNGIDPGGNPTSLFIELAAQSTNLNIERLFEYCWINKDAQPQGSWEQFIEHGVLNPLTFLLLQAFYVNGVGIKQLQAGKMVASFLNDGDLVLNLNYDTLFEIAARQIGRQITYVPNLYPGHGLLIAKPHGSLNLLANASHFHFAEPECIGALHSSANDYRNYHAIIPPRFNKKYVEHDIAKSIFDSIQNIRPEAVTFWGVGLTESDADLLDTYRSWAASGAKVEVINPDASVRDRAQLLLAKEAFYFPTLEEWLT